MKTVLFYCGFVLLFISCSCQKEVTTQSYLALGDSYTIGESVAEDQRWPVQLKAALAQKNIPLSGPTIIAKTGWTTDELKMGIDTAPLDYPYDWVSLLIGVNNQYRGRSIEEFRSQFEILLSEAITYSGNRKDRVFVVSIPDWGVMPVAADRDQEKIATEIDNFNQVIYEICVLEDVHFVDITPISRTIEKYPDYIAQDGLHPSGKQYAAWVQQILPFFLNQTDD
ncbi:MAG: SGNH/GDSL hydrolase family protein [Flavobacteriaceae bacterium]